MRRTTAWVTLGVAMAPLGLVACGGDGGSTAGPMFLVLPESTPGLVVAEAVAPEQGYGSGVLRSDADGGTGTVAMVQPEWMVRFDVVTAGAVSATLPNGLEVFSICGGRSTSATEGSESSTVTASGPLMVVARVEGGVLSVEDTPTDTSSCTQPTAVEGPLVDVAASLRWVDEAEFQRMLERFPAPERTSTPTTG